MYPVSITAPVVPVAGDRQVIFHGVNKSGSAAITRVLKQAYYAERRANQFWSTYDRIPRHVSDFVEIMQRSSGHGFFVGHYIYDRFGYPRDTTLLVTQLRHPLPRTLSVYGWQRRAHAAKHGSDEGFASIADWLHSRGPVRQTQMAQFAVQAHDGRNVAAMAPEDVLEAAIENFDRDVAWFGIAELFEESIFALAHLCGLEAVPAWQKDTRNAGRPALADTEPETIDLITELHEHEFAFYRHGLDVFRERIAAIDFGPSFPEYQAACSDQYGERLVDA